MTSMDSVSRLGDPGPFVYQISVTYIQTERKSGSHPCIHMKEEE